MSFLHKNNQSGALHSRPFKKPTGLQTGFGGKKHFPKKPGSNSLKAVKSRAKEVLQLRKEKLKAFKENKMMPFIPRLAYSVESGRTTASFRLHAYPFYPKVGQKFIAHAGNQPIPGVYLCTKRIKTTLRTVSDKYWQDIGMPTPQAYEVLMQEILKTENLPFDTKGYLYHFQRVE
jgi:hypothetical protein